MMNYIFDLDGTIVEDGKPIKNSIATKIKQISLNNKVVFASARPIRDMLPLIAHNLHGCLLLGCNGGMAWQDGEFKFAHKFSDIDTSNMLTYLKKTNIPYVLDGIWNFSVSAVSHPFHDYVRSLSNLELAEAEILQKGITKILILDGDIKDEFEYFLKKNDLNFNLHHHKTDNLFDITPQKENKYLSLVRLGFDFSNTIVFGNDSNDFAMLEKAKTSIFVGTPNTFPSATIYCRIEDIPSVLDEIPNIVTRKILT